MGVGFGAFQANSGVTMYYSSYCAQEYMAVLIIAVFLTLAIGSYFMVGHWLMKEQIIENPLPLILKVVKYTIKGKLGRKYVNSLEQQGILSKLNIAKRIYNGPFTSEQVEDVKTFFRVLVVIMIFTIFSSASTTINDISNQMAMSLRNWPNDDIISGCYHGISINYAIFTYSAAVILIYLVVMSPLFHIHETCRSCAHAQG